MIFGKPHAECRRLIAEAQQKLEADPELAKAVKVHVLKAARTALNGSAPPNTPPSPPAGCGCAVPHEGTPCPTP